MARRLEATATLNSRHSTDRHAALDTGSAVMAVTLAGDALRRAGRSAGALVEAAGSGGDGGDSLPILALALQRMVTRLRKPGDVRITLEPWDAARFLETAIGGRHPGGPAGCPGYRRGPAPVGIRRPVRKEPPSARSPWLRISLRVTGPG